MKNLILLFTAMSLITTVRAQEVVNVQLKDQSILFEPSTNTIIIGEVDRVNLGLFRKHLAKHVHGELAVEEAELATKKSRNGNIILLVSSTLSVGSLGLIPLSWPVALIGMGVNSYLMYYGLELMNKGEDHLQRALWLHNRDAMSGRIPSSHAQGAFR
ncbi:MAG: hypothetical protein ACK417_11140 [Bacteroidia bacterium]